MRGRWSKLGLMALNLAVILVFALIESPAQQAAKIIVENKAVFPREKTTIKISASEVPAPGIASIQGKLNFNSAVFVVNDVKFASNFNLSIHNILNEAGEVRFAATVTMGTPIMGGVLMEFVVETVGELNQMSPVRLTLQVLSDSRFNAIPHEITHGTYTIGGVANKPPKADFSYSPTNPTVSDTVQFTDASGDPDGSIASWTWEFGDGGTSTEKSPSHKYANPGTFTVRLTVTDNKGATDTVAKSVKIFEATVKPPKADFTSSPASPKPGESVKFTDKSTDPDGSVVSWSWEFGDGATSTEQNPTHAYAKAGSYTVKLTVTDNVGAQDTATKTITVSEGGPGPLEQASVHNFPNPSSVSTTFKYKLPSGATSAVLRIFNVTGRLVFQQELDVNRTEFRWDLVDGGKKPLPNGPYYYFVAAHLDGRVVRSPLERFVIQRPS